MAGIAGDLFLKLYLVIFVSGKLALRGWFNEITGDVAYEPVFISKRDSVWYIPVHA